MPETQQPDIVTPEQQRALEQNVYVSAAAAKVTNELLLAIEAHLRVIKSLAWVLVGCAVTLTVKFL